MIEIVIQFLTPFTLSIDSEGSRIWIMYFAPWDFSKDLSIVLDLDENQMSVYLDFSKDNFGCVKMLEFFKAFCLLL